MDRNRGANTSHSIDAQIIPPRRSTTRPKRAAKTIDVHPEFVTAPLRPQRSPRRDHGHGYRILLAVAIALSVLVAFLLLMRGPITDLLPGASAVYRAAGLSTGPQDLTLGTVHVVRVYSRDTIHFTVEGTIVNPTGRQVEIQNASLVLSDTAGVTLRSIDLPLVTTLINPGAALRFAIDIPDPPSALAGMGVVLGDGPPRPITID